MEDEQSEPLPEPAPEAPVADRIASAERVSRTIVDGRWELGRLLGSGGTATVHLARDLLLGREVAVKLFRRDAGAEQDLRLQEIEARVVAALNHSALATLLDAGVDTADDGVTQIYLVMEYVRGANLKERLAQGPMEVSEACWLGFDLAEGLDSMHQAGFLHRDVKPSNILISDVRSARPVVAKLTDFGIAALIGQPDLSEYTVGTAAYLSPEQVEGHDARLESDVYALGLVLLEAITGRVAFPGSVEVSAFERLVRDPTIPADVPPAVTSILRRMTAREPQDRMQLHDVAIELQQFLVDDLVRRRIVAPAEPKAVETIDPIAVERYGTVVDGPDRVFDTLVRLTAGMLGAQRALLALGAGEQARVAAQHGWADPADLPPVPPTLGFPSTAGDPWTVTDALELPAEQGHPLLHPGDRMRSAAAAPLLTRDGRRVGTLAVLLAEPRVFSAAQLAALADFADLAMHEIDLRAATRRALFESP